MRTIRQVLVAIGIAIIGLTASANAGEVTALTLINAKTNKAIGPITNGQTIDLNKIAGGVNVRADVTGDVKSVRFAIDGDKSTRTESTAPFALAGDTNGAYNAWTPKAGKHAITATPFTGKGASGKQGQALTVNFTVAGKAKTVTGKAKASVHKAYSPTPIVYPTLKDESAFKKMSIPAGPAKVSGELKKWHKVTLTFDGPETNEDATPNPFLDYRLDVTFTNGKSTFKVPGHYAADGDAGQSSASKGSKWRVHFSPDATGQWDYVVSFRGGDKIAVSDAPGIPIRKLDGLKGKLNINPSDKTGRDLRGKGRLQYVGERYLRFADTGEAFLKQGSDAPENFLAYADFDGDFATDGQKDNLVKTWEPHVRDWKKGDPSWQGGKGKGIIGAVNYLASEGMNVFSFLTLNIEGDDRNVFPYTTYDERYRMDVSRLDQWEMVFEHGTRNGMYLHFKLTETENELLLDNGDTGVQRKLYHREITSRFGHHLALNWNLGEENGALGQHNQNTPQRKAMAQYVSDVDPYKHHIVIHNGKQPTDLIGDASTLTGYSLQTNRTDFMNVHPRVVEWVKKTADAGKPWVVACDEPGDASHSLITDDEDPEHNDARMNGLWGCLLGGGAGNEWYFGYKHPHSDLTCQDFRSRDLFWDQCLIALDFFADHLPYDKMVNADALVDGENAYCLAKEGEVYAILRRPGADLSLDLGESKTELNVQWFNPRKGGGLQTGSVKTVKGPGKQLLGNPPSVADRDWIILVK